MIMAVPASRLYGHEAITTKLTWSKEVSRVVFRRCLSCHHLEGKAFSLATYQEARPWAKAIQEQVLTRQMPPWNAVKGFGEFRHDQGLSQEEIHILADWVEGGAPEGDRNLLPPLPPISDPPVYAKRAGLLVSKSLRLPAPLALSAIEPVRMAPGSSAKLVALLPSGERLPLIWILNFSPQANPRYELAEVLRLPAGSRLEVQGQGVFRLLPHHGKLVAR